MPRVIAACVVVWLMLVLLSLAFPRSTVFVGTGDADLSYQVYFYDGRFSEENSQRLDTPDFLQGPHSFQTGVSFLRPAGSLFRFDIDPRPRVVRAHAHLPLEPFTVLPIVIVERSLLLTRQAWYTSEQVIMQHSGVERQGNDYRLVGPDAHFLIDLARGQPDIVEYPSWDAFFGLLLLLALAAALRGYAVLFRTTDTRVLFGGATVLAVVVGMSLTFGLAIGTGHGPDEIMHYPSYFWYQENLRPPSLHDPVYLQKVWQSSYILGATGDLPYLLTARVESVVAWLVPSLEPLVSMRLTQIFLILVISGLTVLLLGAAIGPASLLPWLLVPQLAYTATYLNGDVLSFALGFLAFGLVLVRVPANGWWLVPALFILFNLKANYLVLVALIPLVWLCLPTTRPRFQPGWMLGVVLALPLILYRRLFNVMDQKAAGASYLQAAYDRLITLRDTTVHPFSYARESYERRLSGLAGFEWSTLTDLNWYVMSLRSLFGVFGYMEYPVPLWALAPCVLLCLVVVGLAVRPWGQAVVVLAAAGLSVSASLFYSISEGYQPQGRYLFPLVCVVFLLARARLQNQAHWLVWGALPTVLALSLYRPGF